MVGRNTNVEAESGEGSERKEESWREIFHHLGEELYHHEQNRGGNMSIKGDSGEISMEMKNLLLVPGRKVILVMMWLRTWLMCVLLFC